MWIGEQEVYEHITEKAEGNKRPMAIFSYADKGNTGKRVYEAIYCDPKKYVMPENAVDIQMLCFYFGPTHGGKRWAERYEEELRNEGASV